MENKHNFKIDQKLSERNYEKVSSPFAEQESTWPKPEVKNIPPKSENRVDYQAEMAKNGNVYDCGAGAMIDELYR